MIIICVYVYLRNFELLAGTVDETTLDSGSKSDIFIYNELIEVVRAGSV